MTMRHVRRAASILALALAWPVGSWAADDDDALALQVQPPPAPSPSVAGQPRLFLEAVAGRIDQRYGLPRQDARRFSLDLSFVHDLGPGWRLNFSDRLDDIHPTDGIRQASLNSLREGYVTWQIEGGSTLVDFGRVNLRQGTGYGFNPTDFFRDGALRAVTTADPFALRENRLGTVMLRLQHVWTGGALSFALAPRLTSAPASSNTWSLDLGATNQRNRVLVSHSRQLSERVNLQGSLFVDEDRGAQLGLSGSALLTDGAVLHGEWSGGRDDSAWRHQLGLATTRTTAQRLSAGLTYTLPSGTSLTAEYQYNGFAPARGEWQRLGQSLAPEVLGNYLLETQVRQDNATRHALLLYASQKGVGWKNLDLTALLRLNTDDHSRMSWAEVRYHWSKADVALQWQRTSGRASSEFGVVPFRQSVQLLGAYYF